MPRTDFPTSAEYHADAERRAYDLLNSQIARIDAALDFLKLNRSRVLPSIFTGIHTQLVGMRNRAEGFLVMPDHGGATAIGIMGANGCGPKITALTESVDFHVNKATDYRALRDAHPASIAA
ncbi:hypothetical protein [Sphingobium abikonense]|uniref:hypothetical protein n=1 Tax=Sphingobium abikonense TaxID=86193 RepID=UPI003512F638